MTITKKYSLLFGYLVMSSSCYHCREAYRKHVWPVQLSGIITQKDSIGNHGTPEILIREGTWYERSWALDGLTAFWNALRINDSIFKEKNGYAFQIVRRDTTLTFYPICDCCDTLRTY